MIFLCLVELFVFFLLACHLCRYAVAYGDNGIKGIKTNLISLRFSLNSAMLSGYFHFGNNHVFV